MIHSSLLYLQECLFNEKCPLEFSPKNSLAAVLTHPIPQDTHGKGHMDFSLPKVKNVPGECKFSAAVHSYIWIYGLFVWFGVLLCSLPLKEGFDLLQSSVKNGNTWFIRIFSQQQWFPKCSFKAGGKKVEGELKLPDRFKTISTMAKILRCGYLWVDLRKRWVCSAKFDRGTP